MSNGDNSRRGISVGDQVNRMMGGEIAMALTVTAITEDRIICGPWEFDKETGAEIDEDLGWGKQPDGSWLTGSYLRTVKENGNER